MSATTARRTRTRRRSKPWKRRLKMAFWTVVIVFGVPALVLLFMFMHDVADAKSKLDKINQTVALMGDEKPSVILSADQKVLYRVSEHYRDVISNISDVPQVVRNATLAAEDKRFYQHSGVDYWALARMLFTNVREGRLAQGGSTLEMQLAKRLASTGEKTFRRKMQDVALAFQMGKSYTKDQILLLYLNQVYYGSGAYGVKAAANVYFGKRLDQLTASDAAILARCVRRPSKENPFDDLEASMKNRDVVLGIMRDEKMIDDDTYESALKAKPHLRRRVFGSGAVTFAAPYFVQHVLDTVKRELPDIDLNSGGYTIQTTLDTRVQDVAEEQVRRIVAENRRRRVTTAAFVLMDADGKIVAMVGGVDFKRNQYNVVTQGHRQPGSAFKPFVYATALANGDIEPNTMISDAPYRWTDPSSGETKVFKNSNGKYGGRRSVKSAIAWSVNVCAVRVIMDYTSPAAVVATAQSAFDFHSKLEPYPSLALGSSVVTPLEMAQGYSVFMLRGDRATPFAITRVIGPDGMTIRTFEPNIVRGALNPEVCDEMDGFLREVVTNGTATHYSHLMPPNCRGKTGTTSENKDAWFCGYTDNLVGIGWVGNEHYDKEAKQWVYEPMTSDVFGGTVTVKMWANVMKKAVDVEGHDFKRTKADAFDTKAGDVPAKGGLQTVPGPNGAAPGDNATAPGTTPPGGTGEAGPKPLDLGPTAAASPQTTGSPEAREPRTPSVSPGERPAPKPRKKPETQYVEVEVCAESGLRATMYCPETVIRRFVKGHEPKRRCNIHTP